MDTCKYVVVNTHEGGLAAFIFPPFINHRQFAMTLFGGVERVASAGFVQMWDGQPKAYGESVALDLKSNPERDSDLIRRLLPKE